MPEPLILAIDIGPSSSRVAFFDITARRLPLIPAHHDYPVLTSPDGKAEIEPGAMLGAVRNCITEALHRRRADGNLRGRPITAIGASGFWHGIVGCTDKGEAITRVITGDDTRSRDAAAVLRKRFEERKVHARTGCMLRAKFWPAKMACLQRTESRLFSRVQQWMSPAEWLQLRLAGSANCAIGMATGTGIFDPSTQKWDPAMLKSCEIDPGKLRPLGDEPAPVGGHLAQEFPELRGVPWFPGIGAGAAVNLGCGAMRPGLAAIDIGTGAAIRVMRDGQPSAPFGLGCFRVDAKRHLVEGAVSNAGNLRSWCLRELRLTDGPELEAALASRPGPHHGLVVLPFWTAEHAPSWIEEADGTVHGIRQATTALDLLQAITESTFHRIGRIIELISPDGAPAPKLIVTGAIRKSAASLDRLANVLGRPIFPCDEADASLRGAAVHALQRFGYPIPDPRLINPVKPRKASAHEYAGARERQRDLEELLCRPGP